MKTPHPSAAVLARSIALHAHAKAKELNIPADYHESFLVGWLEQELSHALEALTTASGKSAVAMEYLFRLQARLTRPTETPALETPKVPAPEPPTTPTSTPQESPLAGPDLSASEFDEVRSALEKHLQTKIAETQPPSPLVGWASVPFVASAAPPVLPTHPSPAGSDCPAAADNPPPSPRPMPQFPGTSADSLSPDPSFPDHTTTA